MGVWAAAVFGIVLNLVRLGTSSKLGATLDMVMGWAVVVAMPVLVTAVPPTTIAPPEAGACSTTSARWCC